VKWLVALAAFGFVSYAQVENRATRFLSWYNGWGTHTVWGLGETAGNYADAWVQCGKEKVKVEVIYDTHFPVISPPAENQSQEFARRHNLGVAKDFQNKGVQCEFKK
jgi:hypothetical protein